MRSTTVLAGIAALVAAAFFISATPQAYALDTNSTDSLTTSVNVSKKTIVDVSPASLTWSTALDPGTAGARKDIQIENLGSVNITHVWFNVTQPSEMPFGTGSPSKYDAGNWIAISNDTAGIDEYRFVDRKEFNHTNRIIYLTDNDGDSPPNQPYGRFRNASFEYFWVLDCDAAGTANNCSEDSDDLYVGDTPHTDTQTGDADLQDNAANSLTYVGDNWGVTDVTVNGMDLCVAVNNFGNVTRWYKWDKEAPGASTCTNDQYLVNADSGDAITPGGSSYARTKVHVPFGVPFNSTESTYDGTLYVIANTI